MGCLRPGLVVVGGDEDQGLAPEQRVVGLSCPGGAADVAVGGVACIGDGLGGLLALGDDGGCAGDRLCWLMEHEQVAGAGEAAGFAPAVFVGLLGAAAGAVAGAVVTQFDLGEVGGAGLAVDVAALGGLGRDRAVGQELDAVEGFEGMEDVLEGATMGMAVDEEGGAVGEDGELEGCRVGAVMSEAGQAQSVIAHWDAGNRGN